MKLVLDTNLYSDYAEGLPEVVEAMVQYGQDLFIPSIVLGELTYGFMKGTRRVYNERKLSQIISLLRIEIIPGDADVARKYGFIFLAPQKKESKSPSMTSGSPPAA